MLTRKFHIVLCGALGLVAAHQGFSTTETFPIIPTFSKKFNQPGFEERGRFISPTESIRFGPKDALYVGAMDQGIEDLPRGAYLRASEGINDAGFQWYDIDIADRDGNSLSDPVEGIQFGIDFNFEVYDGFFDPNNLTEKYGVCLPSMFMLDYNYMGLQIQTQYSGTIDEKFSVSKPDRKTDEQKVTTRYNSHYLGYGTFGGFPATGEGSIKGTGVEFRIPLEF